MLLPPRDTNPPGFLYAEGDTGFFPWLACSNGVSINLVIILMSPKIRSLNLINESKQGCRSDYQTKGAALHPDLFDFKRFVLETFEFFFAVFDEKRIPVFVEVAGHIIVIEKSF